MSMRFPLSFFQLIFGMLIGFVLFLSLTTSGLTILIHSLEFLSFGNLHIEKIEGRLLDKMSLHQLNFHTDTLHITADTINLSWKPSALLEQKLFFNNVFINHLKIQQLKNNASSQPDLSQKNSFAWLNKINLEHAQITSFTFIDENKAQTSFKRLTGKWLPEKNIGLLNFQEILHQFKMQEHIRIPILSLNFDQTHFVIAPFTGQYKKFPFHGEIAAQITDDTLTFQKFFLSIAENTIHLSGKISSENINIKLNALIPSIEKINTNAHGNIQIKGLLQGSLKNTHFEIKTFYQNLKIDDYLFKDGTANVTGNSNKNIVQTNVLFPEIKTSVWKKSLKNLKILIEINLVKNLISFSGEGTLNTLFHYKGTVNLAKPDYPAELFLEGKNLAAMDDDEYIIQVSPILHLTYIEEKLNLTGKITVPYARIHPKDLRSTTTLSKDVVIVNTTKPIKKSISTPLPLYANVSLDIGPDVIVDVEGLRGKISGHLAIIQENDITHTNGTLFVENGQYRYHGESLPLKEGKLIFLNSPVDNPYVKINFQRTIKISEDNLNLSNISQIQVGLTVDGTLDNPIYRLYSQPGNLSQEDILSYLLLGRPLSNTEGVDAQIIMKALSSLNKEGTGQFSSLMEGLQKNIGLDQLQIKSEDSLNKTTNSPTQNLSLLLGKALSPRLWIQYSIGISEPISIFRIRYLLHRRWTLQAETGQNSNGIDLIYLIERK